MEFFRCNSRSKASSLWIGQFGKCLIRSSPELNSPLQNPHVCDGVASVFLLCCPDGPGSLVAGDAFFFCFSLAAFFFISFCASFSACFCILLITWQSWVRGSSYSKQKRHFSLFALASSPLADVVSLAGSPDVESVSVLSFSEELLDLFCTVEVEDPKSMILWLLM